MPNHVKFLENALQNVACSVWVLDGEMTCTQFANKKFLNFISLPEDTKAEDVDVFETVARLGTIFDSEASRDGKTAEAVKNLRDTSNFESIMQAVDGRHIKLERFADKDGAAVINFTDVTDLVEATAKAKKAELAKTDFLANMSHEIRTPMNGVIGMTQVLGMTELTDQQQNYVDLIARSGKALVSIINDILDFSKLESGNFSIHTEPFNLKENIDDIVILMGHTARLKNLELVLDMPAQPENKLIGDSGRLRQILINLIGNAIKFTAEGFVKFSVGVKQTTKTAIIDFAITDTGIGIPADKVDNIFLQFQQADSSTTRNFGGTGLGLSISQQLASLMGSDIKVTSESGKGSTFAFSIELPASDIAIQTPSVFSKLSNTPVLVVDDIPLNHLIMHKQLMQIGATPVCVDSSESAINMMRNAAKQGIQFPLVITDFQMPNTNGLGFVEAVRQDSLIRNTPIMVLSSVDMSPYKKRLNELGVTSIYEKPCLAEDLHKAVFESLAETRLEKLKQAAGQSRILPPIKALRPKQSLHVLVVEDDELNRDVMIQCLKNAAVDFTLAINGSQAIERFKENSFDAIFMDIAMPVMDGLSATRIIRKIESKTGQEPTPIIAVTAHILNNQDEKHLRAGMNAYLPKPVYQKTLQQTLETWTNFKSHAA